MLRIISSPSDRGEVRRGAMLDLVLAHKDGLVANMRL